MCRSTGLRDRTETWRPDDGGFPTRHVADGGATMGPTDLDEEEDEDDYAGFIRRLRAGDESAAEELVRRYEPEIRLETRVMLRMRDARLRRVMDSVDVCQSVLASFFLRASIGEFDLDEPGQLIRLLIGMARNKLAEHVRHHQRKRRDVRRTEGFGPAGGGESAGARDESPSQLVAGRELLEMFRDRLSDDERKVADLRARGLDWAAVAAELGGTPEARRKQLTRAIARVEQELGLGVAD
jgi:RNA polymerase sigma-70 factor (ECF subfamily)